MVKSIETYVWLETLLYEGNLEGLVEEVIQFIFCCNKLY